MFSFGMTKGIRTSKENSPLLATKIKRMLEEDGVIPHPRSSAAFTYKGRSYYILNRMSSGTSGWTVDRGIIAGLKQSGGPFRLIAVKYSSDNTMGLYVIDGGDIKILCGGAEINRNYDPEEAAGKNHSLIIAGLKEAVEEKYNRYFTLTDTDKNMEAYSLKGQTFTEEEIAELIRNGSI